MNEFNIREYTLFDLPAMRRIWRDIFDDSNELIDGFFTLLPDIGSAVVAEVSGTVTGAAYIITGMELENCGKNKPVCGYIYAVAVTQEQRGKGIGTALVRESERLARQRGADIVCTLPVEDSLYGWYKTVVGFDCVLHREKHTVYCRTSEPCMELTATEYMMWRDSLLRGKPHQHPSSPVMALERHFCKTLGGGLYASAKGICAAYIDGDTCIVHELIAPSAEESAELAEAVGAFLGAKQTVYYLPSSSGERYIAAPSGSIPADCIWGLSFD